MKLLTFMKVKNIKPSVLAKMLAIPQSQLHQYLYDEVIPGKKILKKIYIVTFGAVGANDFYDLKEDLFETEIAKELLAIQKKILNENKQN